MKAGLAVRIAQELGLMQDAEHDVPLHDQEERRRVFWSVYLLDRLISCGRGRPLAVLDASCHLQLPSTDWAWKGGSLETTPTLDELTDRSFRRHDILSPFAHVVATASLLGRSIQYSLQQFNVRGRCPPWDPSSDFAVLESDLLHLESILELQTSIKERVRSYITPENTIDQPGVSPVILSRIIFHLCYCLLNHPFLLRQRIACGHVAPPTSFLARAFSTGWQHACQMVDLVRFARGHGYMFTASFSGYCVMVAGSILALGKHVEDPYISTQAETSLQEVIAFLESLGKYWYNVSNMVSSLYQFSARDYQSPKLRLQQLCLLCDVHDIATYIIRTDTYKVSALGLVIERSATLRQLSDAQSRVFDLVPADSELIWSVVDYGNISNKASTDFGQDNPSDTDLWFESFFSLFGVPSGKDAVETLDPTADPFSIL